VQSVNQKSVPAIRELQRTIQGWLTALKMSEIHLNAKTSGDAHTIVFYFLFTKFKLHNISLVSTFILGGSQLSSYTTDLLGCKNGLTGQGPLI